MERVVFTNSLGQRIVGILHKGWHGSGLLGPTVVLCHGMMSTKDGTKQVAFSRMLEQRGISALRFDFSFCGESGGRFEEITFSQEVDDAACAVRWVRSRGADPVGLLGSSMGGAVAILYAGRDPSIRAVVTLAAVARPGRIADRMDSLQEKARQWKEEGYRLGGEGEVGDAFLEDARRQDVLAAVRRLAAPLLILHGEQDEVVPVEEAHALYEHAGGPKSLQVLAGVDHRFTQPEGLEAALEAAGEWFERYLLS